MIVKNKQFSQANRLRINMGNIYFQQQKYAQAIKMFQMALDQMPAVNKDLRYAHLTHTRDFSILINFKDAES
jgi:intraflagellar transport protein 88